MLAVLRPFLWKISLKSKAFTLWLTLSLTIHAAVFLLLRLPQRMPQPETGPIEIGSVQLLPPVADAQADKTSAPLQQSLQNASLPATENRSVATAPPSLKPKRPYSKEKSPESKIQPNPPPVEVPEPAEKSLPTEEASMPQTILANVSITSPSPSATLLKPSFESQTARGIESPTNIAATEIAQPASHSPLAKYDPVQIVPPRYRHNPPPPYPSLALKRRWQGEVWLRVIVDALGNVSDARIEQSSGYPVLDEAALATVLNWKFYPARDGVNSVEKEVRLPIRFELNRS